MQAISQRSSHWFDSTDAQSENLGFFLKDQSADDSVSAHVRLSNECKETLWSQIIASKFHPSRTSSRTAPSFLVALGVGLAATVGVVAGIGIISGRSCLGARCKAGVVATLVLEVVSSPHH